MRQHSPSGDSVAARVVWSTSRLAAVARMTRRTFFRRFSAMTDGTPAEWITGLRIARARDLLETTGKPI